MDVFLTHLAVEGKVSASMQNQALATLLFLYRARLGIDLPGHKDVSTTMIYTHVLNRGGQGVVSPLAGLS
jgi:site-specific recombinase XerD